MRYSTDQLLYFHDEPCRIWVHYQHSHQDKDRCDNCGYTIDEHRASWATEAA
jgi:hypothetical protein